MPRKRTSVPPSHDWSSTQILPAAAPRRYAHSATDRPGGAKSGLFRRGTTSAPPYACPLPRPNEVTSYVSVKSAGPSRSPPHTVTPPFSRSSAVTARIAAAGHDISSRSSRSNGCRRSTRRASSHTDDGSIWRVRYWHMARHQWTRCAPPRRPISRYSPTSSNRHSRSSAERQRES